MQVKKPPRWYRKSILYSARIIYLARFFRAPGHYDSDYWRMVFVLMFRGFPKNNEDKRWDTLLHPEPGYDMLRLAAELRGKPYPQHPRGRT